jgi:hypothetical protein
MPAEQDIDPPQDTSSEAYPQDCCCCVMGVTFLFLVGIALVFQWHAVWVPALIAAFVCFYIQGGCITRRICGQ